VTLAAASMSGETGALKADDSLATWILFMPFVAVTFLTKFVIPFDALHEIMIATPIILGATCLGLATHRLEPDPIRVVGFVAVITVLVAEQAFISSEFSIGSISLLAAGLFPYMFRIVGAAGNLDAHMDRCLNLTAFIAVAGVVQYVAQFVIGRAAFPIEHFVPGYYLVPLRGGPGYNALQPLRYGSTILKSNGVFMLEASYFSQTMAIGFGLEAVTRQRLLRLACYCAGFVVAYSGTGLIALAVALPVLIIAHRRYEILFFIVLAGVLLVLLSKPLGLDLFLQRSGEFNSKTSSGFARYGAGFYLWDQYLWHDPKRTLFGLGAGMMQRMTPWPIYSSAETGWVKIVAEYGLVGAPLFFGFLYACMFSSRAPLVLRTILGVILLLSGILDPFSHGMNLTLLVWLPRAIEHGSSALRSPSGRHAPA
jgi:hypothetical protein